jgi:sulfide:quinone oxidoreductase
LQAILEYITDKSAPGDWIKVDKETMVHAGFKNIIAFGDAAGLPTSKTGAAIRMQAPIAAANLIALIEQREPTGRYNGYSACPIITEYGKVLMCEFGYDEKLMPTIPWLDPGIERGMWWTLKARGLKPMYYQGMLKGLL